jgi:hypothetical protein
MRVKRGVTVYVLAIACVGGFSCFRPVSEPQCISGIACFPGYDCIAGQCVAATGGTGGGGVAGGAGGGGAAGGAGGGFDAGFDGGSCPGDLRVDSSGGGRSSILELAGRPRMLYQREGRDAGTAYAECVAGACSPVLLGASSRDPSARPLLVQLGPSGLAAAWPSADAGTFNYAECSSACGVRASWAIGQSSGFGVLHRPSLGLAALGNLRAAVSKGTAGGDIYFECSSGCASGPATWATIGFPNYPNGVGASIAFGTDPVTGLVRRAGIWGSDPLNAANPMLYRECSGSCTSPVIWSGGGLNGGLSDGGLGQGMFPTVVFDRAGLPRIFYSGALPTGPVKLARCTQRPCASQLGNWSFSVLAPSGGVVTAGVAPDGRTWFLSSIDGLPHLGIESDGGYVIAPMPGCARTFATAPAGYLGADNQWRISFAADGGMSLRTGSP